MKRSYEFRGEDQQIAEKKVALVERNAQPNGLALLNPKAVGKRSPNDLMELAVEIQKADNFIHANACNKLQIIAQQVRFLQQQAHEVLLEAKMNEELHHAACNFVKVPGSIYHLYRRPSGQKYFSMLSPNEWPSPHEFLGSFRLEYDQSWTPIDNLSKKDEELRLMEKIISAKDDMGIKYALQSTPMET